MQKFNVKTISYCAVAIAAATVLSLLKLDLPFAFGGSITFCSMFFVCLTGYFFGPAVGIASGVAYGFLQLAFGAYIVHPAQLLMDYPLAFGALGLSGFFYKKKNGLYIGFVVGAVGRWFMHFLSGIIFFSEYAGDQHVIIYSTIYNFSYILPEIILTLIILAVPVVHKQINLLKSRLNA